MNYRIALSLFLFLFTHTVSAQFILSAPPRENEAEAKRIYGPLADELSRITGEKVVFEPPVSWAAYSRNIQEGTYDFVLDGPHFVAWRLAHTGHVPLVRLDGHLGYKVFTTAEGPAELNDLRFEKVCSMASPNLAAVVLLAQFNPYTAPTLVAPRGGVKGSFEGFLNGRCSAVVLPSYFTARLPPEKTADLRVLFATADMPNLALTAGPRVEQRLHSDIVEVLLQAKALPRLQPLLDKLKGTGSGTFIPAREAEFVGHEKLLEGLVWGW
jgi:ABC-type phosphate/phosphonate transport system substrate-binding protein